MAFKIINNAPIPPKLGYAKNAGLTDALLRLEIGDSVIVNVENTGSTSSTTAAVRKRSGRKFTARKVDGGVQIWRVE